MFLRLTEHNTFSSFYSHCTFLYKTPSTLIQCRSSRCAVVLSVRCYSLQQAKTRNWFMRYASSHGSAHTKDTRTNMLVLVSLPKPCSLSLDVIRRRYPNSTSKSDFPLHDSFQLDLIIVLILNFCLSFTFYITVVFGRPFVKRFALCYRSSSVTPINCKKNPFVPRNDMPIRGDYRPIAQIAKISRFRGPHINNVASLSL